jgi:hypothetical protein
MDILNDRSVRCVTLRDNTPYDLLLTVGVPLVGTRKSTVITDVTYLVLAWDLACSKVISLSV